MQSVKRAVESRQLWGEMVIEASLIVLQDLFLFFIIMVHMEFNTSSLKLYFCLRMYLWFNSLPYQKDEYQCSSSFIQCLDSEVSLSIFSLLSRFHR